MRIAIRKKKKKIKRKTNISENYPPESGCSVSWSKSQSDVAQPKSILSTHRATDASLDHSKVRGNSVSMERRFRPRA